VPLWWRSAFEIDDVEQRRFDKLALQHRALHAHKGSCGKTTVPSGMASMSHSSRRSEGNQETSFKKRLLVVAAQSTQVSDVVIVEAEVFKIAIASCKPQAMLKPLPNGFLRNVR
jgi:hypothetical protein